MQMQKVKTVDIISITFNHSLYNSLYILDSMEHVATEGECDLEEDSCVTESSDSVTPCAEGVTFDVEDNLWIPSFLDGMTRTKLPLQLPHDSVAAVNSRKQITQRIASTKSIEPSGIIQDNMMEGTDCRPNLSGSCECGISWKDNVVTVAESHIFVVRTAVGAVARKVFIATCVCGSQKMWNPSDEYIHSISTYEGGNRVCVHSRIRVLIFYLLFNLFFRWVGTCVRLLGACNWKSWFFCGCWNACWPLLCTHEQLNTAL